MKSADSHVLACLVHERPDVVLDLVANLRSFAPEATILLYDGSHDGRLLEHVDLSGDPQVILHPRPRPMRWGRLHDFAIDSMRFALSELPFDALTIVDSDQLLIRPGYVGRISNFLAERPGVGMLGNAPYPQARDSRVHPVRTAWREAGVWRLALARLPGGVDAFPHWTFWPSTVFSRAASADLVSLFEDQALVRLVGSTRIFATEEIVLPTLVAGLGYEIAAHPAKFDYVRYRVGYAPADVVRAQADPDVFWMHPVPREMDHPVRARIRQTIVGLDPTRDPGTTPDASPAATAGAHPAPWLANPDAIGVEALGSSSPHGAAPMVQSLPRGVIASSTPTISGRAARASRNGGRTEPKAVAVDDVRVRGDRIVTTIVDDAGGLLGLAEGAIEAIGALRSGQRLTVSTTHESVSNAYAIVRTLATVWPNAEVEAADRTVSLQIPSTDRERIPINAPTEAIRRHVDRALGVEGWLEPDEAVLLAAAATAWASRAGDRPVVELGSFCGRATGLLGGIAKAHGVRGRVHAIDRFDGVVGERDGRMFRCGPTRERFRSAVESAGLADVVITVVGDPAEAAWAEPIGLLLVDGFHDYPSVAADFAHFEPWLDGKSLVAFHDYASYYPGVRRVVDELLAGGKYLMVGRIRSLVVLGPTGQPDRSAAASHVRTGPALERSRTRLRVASATDLVGTRPVQPATEPGDALRPLVSCLMPTLDRRFYVPDAIAQFLAQDYERRELLVIDDGTDPVEDLMPDDERIRYIRLRQRLTIGAKRNLGCELARGQILAHWDDDDWYASWRLTYEVEALVSSDSDVVGLSRLLYHDPSTHQAWEYRHRASQRQWVHDPTFCYRREAWQSDRFADSNFGLDTRWLLAGRRKRVTALADHRFYIGRVHPTNTSRKNMRDSSWRPLDPREIESTMADRGRREMPAQLAM